MKRLISSLELDKGGVVINDIVIPPFPLRAQAQVRTKRQITYTKFLGIVYYFEDDLYNYFMSKMVRSLS